MSRHARFRLFSIGVLAFGLLWMVPEGAKAEVAAGPERRIAVARSKSGDGAFWHWLGRFWSDPVQSGSDREDATSKAGIIIDPNGNPSQDGGSLQPVESGSPAQSWQGHR